MSDAVGDIVELDYKFALGDVETFVGNRRSTENRDSSITKLVQSFALLVLV